MDAEVLPVDEGGDWETVKHVTTGAPYISTTVLFVALIHETVHGGDLARLVVAAEERDFVRVSDLEEEEEGEGLDRVDTAVDEITEEDEVGGGSTRDVATDAEEF